jgi:putative ABC transport system permease protein
MYSGRLHFAPVRASLFAGLGALRANPLRTALATLGVVIGVGALVAVLAVGDGVERFARDEIARTTDLQTIAIVPRTTRDIDGLRVPVTDYPRFALPDLVGLEAALPDASVVLGASLTALVGVTGDSAQRGAVVTGTVPGALEALRARLTAGAFLTATQVSSAERVAVLPTRLATALSLEVGDEVRLGDGAFRVIGVVEPPDAARFEVFVPLTALEAAATPGATPSAPAMGVRVARVEDVPETRARVERWLAGRWPDWRDRVVVSTNELRVAQTRRAMLVFKLLMAAITGISLVVGGIGIMNVLLASVTERTREIGVRRATGARRRDILIQFLAESVAVTGAGSALGVILGLGTAFAVAAVMRVRTEAAVHAAFTGTTLAMAALAAVVVGLVFGIYPAIRAARLPPIEAIRHE